MPSGEEQRHIEFVIERLTKKHPDLPATTVRESVTRAHTHFDGRRVRDFVPLLVERNAEAELGHAGRYRSVPMQHAQARMFLALLRREIEELAVAIESTEAQATHLRAAGDVDREAELL
ncbi:hypothetical protein SAMN05444580_10240 [Rhodococcus tukisamuensis]|uniref:Uncharacterized protein n=1 Tax=Rhodococcus tukisamuensis TaxID=168276 RepID=A0A1G6QGM1_9NOCA|nr:hypothetical protein SAMN05444580_10240 [Rhodococcus tukisamuensis]